jgi:dTMP kinase
MMTEHNPSRGPSGPVTEAKPSQGRSIPGGLLVALEGLDGAGKSTQARSMLEHLRSNGWESVFEHEPTGRRYGRFLRKLVSEGGQRLPVQQEFELFLCDRYDNQRETVLPALARGAIVLLDRYYISSMAYQGARGLDPHFIKTENERIALRPDLLIYFQLDPELGKQRRSDRALATNDFEELEEQKRVRNIFEQLSLEDFPGLRRIDASQPPEVVFRDFRFVLDQALEDLKLGNLVRDRRWLDFPSAPPAPWKEPLPEDCP